MPSRREIRVNSLLPLNPVVFHILLVLFDGEKHGYHIVREVERETEGHLQIEPGNLYRSLRKMKEEGLIEESDRRPDPAQEDSRRRYFRLTPLGERVLRAEAGRLEHQLEAAWARRLLPLPGRTGGMG